MSRSGCHRDTVVMETTHILPLKVCLRVYACVRESFAVCMLVSVLLISVLIVHLKGFCAIDEIKETLRCFSKVFGLRCVQARLLS